MEGASVVSQLERNENHGPTYQDLAARTVARFHDLR